LLSPTSLFFFISLCFGFQVNLILEPNEFDTFDSLIHPIQSLY